MKYKKLREQLLTKFSVPSAKMGKVSKLSDEEVAKAVNAMYKRIAKQMTKDAKKEFKKKGLQWPKGVRIGYE